MLIHYLYALMLAAGLAPNGPLPGPVPAIVERVVDGDTVRVAAVIWVDQQVQVSVRLAGVDAPELFRPKCEAEKALARQAKLFVEGFLEGGAVRLFDVQYGKYAGRVVARVENDKGEDLAAELLKAGFAAPVAERRDWCTEKIDEN